MKLLIATPLYPPDIGGPAPYAKELHDRLAAAGHTVTLVSFSDVRSLPPGVRHIVYFFRVCRAARGAQAVLAFDTWSTGIPALLAAWCRGAKMVVRIGGDFLWEAYVERTGELIKLSDFYNTPRALSLKERLIAFGTRWLTRNADVLVFNTAWQRRLWASAYGFMPARAYVVENAYPAARDSAPPQGRVFVAAGRPRLLKNSRLLERAIDTLRVRFPDIELDSRVLPPHEHEKRLRDAYAIVIPSVSEVSPNTAIDAIRYGKPFVLSTDTGVRERLADAGIWVDPLDEDALRAALERLLDPEEYMRACHRVRSFAYTHTWEEVAAEFESLLMKLCGS